MKVSLPFRMESSDMLPLIILHLTLEVWKHPLHFETQKYFLVHTECIHFLTYRFNSL